MILVKSLKKQQLKICACKFWWSSTDVCVQWHSRCLSFSRTFCRISRSLCTHVHDTGYILNKVYSITGQSLLNPEIAAPCEYSSLLYQICSSLLHQVCCYLLQNIGSSRCICSNYIRTLNVVDLLLFHYLRVSVSYKSSITD